MKYRLRWITRILLIIIAFFFLPIGCMVAAHYSGDNAGFRSPNRHGSTQQAPPAESDFAVIQVYAARAARWRGAFGVHTWITTKKTHQHQYSRLEVIGYRVYWGGGAVRVRNGVPDAMWYGNKPTLLREVSGGVRVDEMIDRLHAAAKSYPYDNIYHVWPGPNSNTFTAHLARQVPELRLELPSTAIGKDYLPGGAIAAVTPSGTGAQLSFFGYFGLLAGFEEGIEFNILGLTAGIDLLPPAIKLPGIGRLGFSDVRRITISDDDST